MSNENPWVKGIHIDLSNTLDKIETSEFLEKKPDETALDLKN